MGATTAKASAESQRRLVLWLLVAAYTLNFVDRTIISAIGQAIKDDLKITDTQLGLLGGLYFALLYTVLGIPVARLAERMSRVNIISAAILIWSGFTALCGMASSYAILAACRFGVGVGEAGLSPPAHSLISDYYEPEKRASALSIYSLGVPIGVMIGAVGGGWLAQNYSWRVAFIILGLPGVLLAIALKLLVREPVRGAMEAEPPAPRPPYALSDDFRETARVARAMFGNWTLFNMMLGITLISFAGYGGGAFVQPYWSRTFGLDYAQVGLITGLIGGTSQGAGVLLGGLVSDRLARRGATIWYGLVPAIGIAASYPLILAIYTADSWQAAAAWMLFPGALSYTYMGPTYGVVQNAFPPERRATATAVLFFVLNLVALGFGPPLTGWLIDHLGAFHHANPGIPGVLSGLANLFSVDAAAFQAACPGGSGSIAGSAADRACRSAVELATRQGVLIAYAVGLWAALHYLLAAIGLRRGMPQAG
jgi:predicted MFS family arabinose efflux permease